MPSFKLTLILEVQDVTPESYEELDGFVAEWTDEPGLEAPEDQLTTLAEWLRTAEYQDTEDAGVQLFHALTLMLNP